MNVRFSGVFLFFVRIQECIVNVFTVLFVTNLKVKQNDQGVDLNFEVLPASKN